MRNGEENFFILQFLVSKQSYTFEFSERTRYKRNGMETQRREREKERERPRLIYKVLM